MRTQRGNARPHQGRAAAGMVSIMRRILSKNPEIKYAPEPCRHGIFAYREDPPCVCPNIRVWIDRFRMGRTHHWIWSIRHNLTHRHGWELETYEDPWNDFAQNLEFWTCSRCLAVTRDTRRKPWAWSLFHLWW